jgi:chromate transport protein ChrA
MTHFLFDLALNLSLLVIVRIACHLYNRFTAAPAVNGSHVFASLAVFALLLDAALTFVVFADSQSRYGQFSSPDAFVERACAYGLAIVVASVWSYIARRARPQRASADKPVVIRTSAYSESHLHM